MKSYVRYLLPALVLVGMVWLTASHVGPSQGPVRQFNEGFSDSKLDDCEQGFQAACDWLKEAR